MAKMPCKKEEMKHHKDGKHHMGMHHEEHPIKKAVKKAMKKHHKK